MKRNLPVEAQGGPLVVLVAPANVHDREIQVRDNYQRCSMDGLLPGAMDRAGGVRTFKGGEP